MSGRRQPIESSGGFLWSAGFWLSGMAQRGGPWSGIMARRIVGPWDGTRWNQWNRNQGRTGAANGNHHGAACPSLGSLVAVWADSHSSATDCRAPESCTRRHQTPRSHSPAVVWTIAAAGRPAPAAAAYSDMAHSVVCQVWDGTAGPAGGARAPFSAGGASSRVETQVSHQWHPKSANLMCLEPCRPLRVHQDLCVL